MTKQQKAMHEKRFPNESEDYRRSRLELLEAEIGLRRQVESVARLRRGLPLGGKVREDYVFEEGEEARAVRLSELFGDKDTLIAYSFMYGPKVERPCPSCTSIVDSLDGAATHVNQQASLVVIGRSPIARLRAFAAERGWTHVRLLSSAKNSYNADYHAEDASGSQWPVLNVFTRNGKGIYHSYASELLFAPADPGQDRRHVDMIWPLWNLLDVTPQGRGTDFRPKLSYG
jgi:predicted dithiol-disulfide oxidoreductase (DUF899 family)